MYIYYLFHCLGNVYVMENMEALHLEHRNFKKVHRPLQLSRYISALQEFQLPN